MRFSIIIAMALSSVFFATGCSSKRGGMSHAGMGDIDNIGGVIGTDIFGEELGPRGTGTEYESQFDSVYFAYDSSQIDAAERFKIERVAEYLQREGETIGLIVEGHSDERGSHEYNLALGERRALAARAYLVGLGIAGDRIQTKSFGEEKPSSIGHDDGSWSENRRCEFVLFY